MMSFNCVGGTEKRWREIFKDNYKTRRKKQIAWVTCLQYLIYSSLPLNQADILIGGFRYIAFYFVQLNLILEIYKVIV